MRLGGGEEVEAEGKEEGRKELLYESEGLGLGGRGEESK